MTKVNGNNNVSAEYKIVNGKKVKKQEQSKNQKQVFNNKGQKTPQKPNDSAIKQEVYKKSGYQLKDTKDRNKIIQLKVNGKIRSYKTVGTLTTGGRILVQDAKGAYHVVSHTKDNKLIMLKDDYAKNKIFYESTSSEHKVKYGKKNYVITNSKRDRHGRMSAIDENGKRVVLSSDGKELKTGYVEAEDQKDNMNDYIAKQTKGKSKAEADKIRQRILSGNSSYSNKGVLRFKASNGEVWYYDTKRKTYVKYAEKEAQAIIKNLDKGATENWLLFRTGLGTDYELLKNTNAQIIDPEVLNKVNKHYSAEYGNKVDKNAQYGSGKYKTAYEAFLASEIGDDEVYQFNAALVKNNAITDQSRRNEILQTNLTKIKSNGLGVSGRANRLAAADAASTKEDYQTLQDAAEEELKKTNYKAPFKGSDALQTYIYGVNNGDVQEIDDFNTTLIDPKEDMIDRDEIVKIKAETGALWAKKGKYDKAFEAQDGEIVDKMFALQDANGKASLNVKELKAKAKGFQGEYLMFAKPELFTEQELADKAVSMLTVALDQFDFIEKQNSLQSESVLHNLSHSRSDVVASAMSDNGTKNASKNAIEASISKAYTLIRNDKVLNLVKQKMGDKFNLLQKKEQAMFKTNTFANVTTKNDNVKSNLSAEEVAQNKYVVSWLKNQLEDLERDKKMNEAKEGWKQTAVDAMRTSLRAGETRESLANKYDLIKSNMARLEAAAEGKLVDASGKPVSFEDAMKNLGETGIQALEHANADYQTAQQTGEFMVDMAVLALPLPKGFNAANTVIKMGNALYKVISKSDKACKVIKITQEAIKGSKIYEVATKVATTNPKLVENTRKVATIMNSSATGAMHMAGKTVVLDASNIATSREGFTSDRISEMNTKTQSAAVFGGMGGAIGGTTAVASEFVSSAGAKYAVHGVGLVADLMGAAGLMTAESHGETNFWDNLRCVNPDGSFNFEQASMTAMMIFGHLHGMSAVRGKVKPHVELQADGTFKAKLGDNVLTLNKDGIWSDSASGREFRLAENKNGKAELTELTKKEVAARHSEASAEESRGTSSQQINSFKERINNAKTREELNAIRDDIKKTDLTVQERNELMTESLKVQREWSQAPERSHIVNMATEGEASVMGKPELTALRNELGIKQTKKGSKFVYEDNVHGLFIKEQMRNGKNVVSYYYGSNPINGDTCLIKYNIKDSKAENVEVLNTKTTPTTQKLYEEHLNNILRAVELKQTGGEQVTNKNIEKTTVSNDKKSVVENKGEGEKTAVEQQANEPVEKLAETKATETKSAAESNSETYNPEQMAEESATGNTPEQAAAIHNSEVETAQRIEEVEANSQHRAELLDEYLAESGEKLPSEIGTKEYYDEALSTIDRGVKSGLIEPQKAEVLRTQAKEQLARLESESSQPATETAATDKSVVAEGSRVTTETPQKTEQTPVNASENEANQIKPETKATDTKSDKSTGEKSQVKIEQKNNKEFSTSDIPVELSEMEEYVKNSNVVEFPENENTYTYSIKNDKTGKLMYVRFNNKNSKRSSITIVEANKQEQHIEFTKDGENPTKVTYKDADGNIIKYAEYEYNKNNQITKGTERNADGSLKGSSEYEYDGNDKLVKLTNKDADGKVIESRELKYNDAGKLTEQIEKDADGKITGVFDGDGNPLKLTPTANDKNPVNASEGEAIQQKNRFTDNKQMSSEKIVADETPINELNNSELESKINALSKEIHIANQKNARQTASNLKKIRSNAKTLATERGFKFDNQGKIVERPQENVVVSPADGVTPSVKITADKIIINGKEQSIPTFEEAQNTLKHEGGKDYSIKIGEPDNKLVLNYDDNGNFKGSIEQINNEKGKALKDTCRNADGTLDKTVDYFHTNDGESVRIERDSNDKPTKIEWGLRKITFDKEGKASYEVTNEKNETVTKPIEEAFKDYPELKPLLKKQGIKLVEKKAEPVAEASAEKANEGQPVTEPEKQPVTPESEKQSVTPESENTPDGFPKTPSKPKQLEKKTLEEILGDEKAPKTADEAKEYAKAHEDAEFVVDEDPNNCNKLFLDKKQNNIVFYNKDGSIQSYREISPSKGVRRRDTVLNPDGTVKSVKTRATNGDLKVEYYEKGNLTQKELYSNENNVWTDHEVYFDSEGNMTGAKKFVQNNETWEQTAEYEYNTKDNVFEQKNEKREVVSTVKYDEATEHWAEFDAEGKVVHEINKPEPVVESESAPAGEETPVGENSKTADAKPSKISMFDKLFHRNKARLENEVEAGTRISWEHTYKTQRDENGYVRTKTDKESNVVRQKEYFNAKGKKIKTETFDIKGKKSELTEGNVTTRYNEDGTIKSVKYPNYKNVYFKYNDNGKLIGAQFWEGHNDLHPKNWNDSEFLATKRRTNYKYNSDSDKPHFELLDEKGKVVTDEKGKPVGTATFDPETRHWVEDGQYSSDLAPKTTNLSRGEGRFRIKLPERNKVPKNLRDENGKLREGVTQNDKGYIESITKDEVVTTKNYDSKGTLVSETTENLTKYYNKNGDVICTKEILADNKGVKITEKTKDYDLEVIQTTSHDDILKIKHHTKNKNGTAKGTEEFKYNENSKLFENKSSEEGPVLKSVEYDADKHSWTIRDGEGKKLDSQNNMKESHIKRNIGIGAGVLALGGIVYGFATSGDDKDVEQSAKAIAEQTAKAIAEQAANAKAETKVTLDGKEGTIAEDGTLTLDGKKYPKDTDGTYAIGDKKYKVENGKLVEVVDTPDDNGETGGAAPDESPEVKGTVDGKEYTINSDGSATIGGHMYEKESDGYYHTEDGSIYGIGEDGKLVKIDKTQTGSDGSQAGSAGSATQTGSDSAQAGNTGATSQQTGNTNTTGNNTHVTAPAQPADSSASTRTTGTTHNDTSVTTRHTNVPAEESRVNSSRPSERSEESRHTGNTPETGVTEPTEEQMQVAKTLQDEISSISTQADVKAFFTKAISAYNAGKITLMQLDVLKTQVENYVETLNEAIKIQNEQDAIQKPEFGLGEGTTPQEPQPKEKREITPVERMELTQKIRKATDRKDIEEIQKEMRQYKVFPGRKNLRRAYKAKLRAIKHQDEPQKVKKYNEKFKKRMDKIEDSKVYKNDNDQINRENFQKMKYFDDIIKRPKDFDDGMFNA